MSFDDWYVVINHKYKNTDDTEALRLLRACWFTAQVEQREADAKICENLPWKFRTEFCPPVKDDCAAAIRNQK